jgi:hypothetical protein
MDKPEDSPLQACPDRRVPWEQPSVTLVGTISLLVRAGSPPPKGGDNMDGDGSQFQAPRP